MGLVTALLPVIGAGAGYYLWKKGGKDRKVEGLLVGLVAGTVAQVVLTQYPGFGLGIFPANLQSNQGTHRGTVVVTGKQSTGSFIF